MTFFFENLGDILRNNKKCGTYYIYVKGVFSL